MLDRRYYGKGLVTFGFVVRGTGGAMYNNLTVLERMRPRGYTREVYLELVQKMPSIIPDEKQRKKNIWTLCLSLYDMAFMFAYSMREKTHAHRNYVDDVPEQIKSVLIHRLELHSSGVF
ncbi:hypothetical protein K1719_042306 [Acacia pycnantha]|nr:hypothetical protein K1719_042306 [Acacia pycnantha]